MIGTNRNSSAAVPLAAVDADLFTDSVYYSFVFLRLFASAAALFSLPRFCVSRRRPYWAVEKLWGGEIDDTHFHDVFVRKERGCGEQGVWGDTGTVTSLFPPAGRCVTQRFAASVWACSFYIPQCARGELSPTTRCHTDYRSAFGGTRNIDIDKVASSATSFLSPPLPPSMPLNSSTRCPLPSLPFAIPVASD